MRKIFIAALAAVAMVSCAKDEAVEINKGDAIGFAATTGRTTRTVTIDGIDEFNKFRVWGFHNNGGKPTALMTEVLVEKDANGDWGYGDPYFWPTVGTCDFYGIYPVAEDTPIESHLNPLTIDMAKKQITYSIYNGNKTPNNPVDWVYSVNTGEVRQDTEVPMNFRHAMSQIVFQVKNTNKNLKITIPEGIIILDCASQKGVYTLPSEDTTKDQPYESRVMGSWEVAKLGEDVYSQAFAGIKGAVLDGVSNCLVADFMKKDGAMITVPQTVVAYDNENDPNNENSQAYFRMSVLIEQEDTEIWPGYTADEGVMQVTAGQAYWVAIPIDATWLQGKKYTYTFIFGDGAGIVPPGTPVPPGGEIEPGDPILAPIDFTVTIDDIEDAGNEDIEL